MEPTITPDTLIHCPRCQARLIRSTTFLEGGMPLIRCVPCNRFLVEGSDQWIDAGPGLRDTLNLIAGNVKHDKEAVKAVMESDWSDPRWDLVERLVD